ncbi:methylenetetrahydrofolate reductase [Corynebacterium choanae]|uniref:Methylenetetrahydrofolate reductase n=1 Tax=Corynebacterium choanae TaxID=1862358 RepID=A0A3G6J512_9CORY|nr:methylenetetrahydrofolate reductase [Corynebacterium choanae]AZA13175.1 5,10-methylenetetrahydrofolate reductase [Corynebacterium choanae]
MLRAHQYCPARTFADTAPGGSAAAETDDTCVHPPQSLLQGKVAFSFEVMPPRDLTAAPKFWATLEQLVASRPDFISVTYGAAGQDRRGAREVTHSIAFDSPTVPIAHFTCVGTSVDEVRQITNDYLDSGVRTFLALRGDPPANRPDWQPADDALTCAADLVRLIRQEEFSRCAEHPSQALRASLRPLRIGVAAFPDGNPAAGTTVAQEVERLVHKQVAGADFAITQTVWSADTYATFVREARAKGVTIPIIPGILPPVEARRLHRVHELTGVPIPERLLADLSAAPDSAAAATVGYNFAGKLIVDLIAEGAPGIHLYTFNQAEPALRTLDRATELLTEN